MFLFPCLNFFIKNIKCTSNDTFTFDKDIVSNNHYLPNHIIYTGNTMLDEILTKNVNFKLYDEELFSVEFHDTKFFVKINGKDDVNVVKIIEAMKNKCDSEVKILRNEEQRFKTLSVFYFAVRDLCKIEIYKYKNFRNKSNEDNIYYEFFKYFLFEAENFIEKNEYKKIEITTKDELLYKKRQGGFFKQSKYFKK